ncbi:YitT family protein [Cohnella sp. GCM10012308]|uniref:YitT family protein n=1 Tax=Cohnella sp. GCM10012308 TaxID=3317329 RepID=UPI0036124373
MNHIMHQRRREWLLIVLGCIVTAIGVSLLKEARIVTGGSAGLALSLSYLFHMKFPVLFILINLPFLLFAWVKMGRSFTLRTIGAIALLSGLTSLERLLPEYHMPVMGEAVAGGALVGIGICILFKNGASFGGSTVLARYLQLKYGRDPGKTGFAFDLAVIATSLSAISLGGALISALSLAITGTLISLYKGRLNASRHQTPGQTASATAPTAAAG